MDEAPVIRPEPNLGGFEFGSGSTLIGLDGITVSIDYITAPSD